MKRSLGMQTWTRRAVVGVFAVSLGVVVACGSSKPPAAGDGTVNLNDGTCNTEGVTRSCHFTVPQPGMLVCGTGAQTCTGGTWTDCNGSITGSSYTLHPEYTYDPAAPAGQRLRASGLMPIANGAPNAGLAANPGLLHAATLVTVPPANCVNNPCDPNCLQIPLPGVQLCGLVSEKPKEWFNALNGSYKFQPSPCTTGASQNCGYDSTCQPDTTCRFNGNKTQTCAGVDFTAGLDCDPGNSSPATIPVCNRGGTDADTGTIKIAWSTTATNLGASCTRLATANTCSVDLSLNPIKSGRCVNFDKTTCPGLPTSGTIMFNVNDDGAGGARLAECNTCNNWGAADLGTSRKCSFSCNSKDKDGNDQNYNNLPGGLQQNPATCNIEAPTTTTVAGTPAGTDPAGATLADNCNFDFQCVDATTGATNATAAACSGCGTCKSFVDNDKNHCVGVDLTAGVGCTNGDGIRFRVCNRGTVDFPGPFDVGLDAQNAAVGCVPVAPGQGNCTFNKDIKAGECVTVSEKDCPGWNASGNRMIHVDPNGLVAECDECNNWSEFANNDSCAQDSLSSTFNFQIPSSCAPGYVAKWGKLFYATSVPGGAEIIFQAQTGPTATGPWLPAAPPTIADVPSPDAQICATACASGSCSGPYLAPFAAVSGSTPAVCPKDLTGPLGANATGTYLNLSVTMSSQNHKKSTDVPIMLAPPVVMFDCVPNE